MTSRYVPYATTPARLLAQLVSDFVVAVWIAIWVVVGMAVHSAVAAIAEFRQQTWRAAPTGSRATSTPQARTPTRCR